MNNKYDINDDMDTYQDVDEYEDINNDLFDQIDLEEIFNFFEKRKNKDEA